MTDDTATPDPAGEAPAAPDAVSAAPAAAVPTPGPRPVPRPGARPVPGARRSPGTAASAARPAPPPPTARSDPRRHGRVDTDGTVWLVTAGGERAVGTWHAGDADAAFAHFGRRFDDLSTEITLLESRLDGGGDARRIRAAATALADGLPTATVLGDVDSLAARLATLVARADDAVGARRAQRDEQRAAQLVRKEALAAEAETIAQATGQWKAGGDRLRAILEEWRTVTGLDRKADDALWKRYSAARETFNRRRGAHFAELDRERTGIKAAKERLCVRAEDLSRSTDWGPTAAAFRALLAEWKTVGRTSKDLDDALWARFKAAQDTFFAARTAAGQERDAELVANAAAKESLLVEAEKITVTDARAGRAALRSLAERWEAIGRVPRERTDLEKRLRAIETRIREVVDAPQHDPEAQARAAQFLARAEQFERQAAKATAAGRTADAEAATASARQWQEWAGAAADAVGRTRR